MSKADSLKEELSWLKVLCGASMAGSASLLGWLVQNYATANRMFVVVAAIAFAPILAVFIVASVVRMYRCIRELEAL